MVAPQLHHGHEHCCRHSGCDDDGDGLSEHCDRFCNKLGSV